MLSGFQIDDARLNVSQNCILFPAMLTVLKSCGFTTLKLDFEAHLESAECRGQSRNAFNKHDLNTKLRRTVGTFVGTTRAFGLILVHLNTSRYKSSNY